MQPGPRNPYLADSGNAMAHGRCDQQDNVPWRGPEGPTEVLGPDDIQYEWLGPCHFGGFTSGPYPDGRRVIWSNGRQNIVKLDYDTLEILADHEIVGGEGRTPVAELQELVAGLDELEGTEAIEHAIGLSMRFALDQPGVATALPVSFLDIFEKVVAACQVDRPNSNEEAQKIRKLGEECLSVFHRQEKLVAIHNPRPLPAFPDSPHEGCPCEHV